MSLGNSIAILKIRKHDESVDNTAIYTQAIEDWKAGTWTDFYWESNSQYASACKLGYEVIGANWLGTHRANVTNQLIVVPDNSGYRSDVPSLPPVMQGKLYKDMQDVLCGKRGGEAFYKMERAKKVDG
jgi:hypothetical protein